MNVLITGSTGQIGWELVRRFPRAWHIHATGRNELDLDRPESIADALGRTRPDVIINAAGYTAVDRAEDEPDLARRVNAEGVRVLAGEAAKIGAAFVHLSTDYVFDGAGRRPYGPDDQPNPQSAYARSKLEGERAALDSGAACLVFRTCWVYSLRGRNFLLTMLQQAKLRSELRVVNDQTGSPTWARPIAAAVGEIVSKNLGGVPGGRTFGGREGIYHLACGGATTWFDFARAIFEEAAISQPRIVPISSRDYAARAARPAYSVLDCSRTFETFQVTMPPWREALRQALGERAAALGSQPTIASASPTGVSRA